MIVAVVPVKRLAGAKQRLAGLLGPSQRAGLALAMLGDVLDVLSGAPAVGRIVVIGYDEAVAAVAREHGARFQTESGPGRGLNHAIEEAVSAYAAPADALLVLPGDVPAVTAADIDRLLALAPPRGVVVVPAIDGGTNALLLSPPDVIPPQFGPDSADRHLQAARQAGAAAASFQAASLLRDIDTVADLRWAAQAAGTGARTRAFLDAELPSALRRLPVRSGPLSGD
jgi:2-phospho-L-lactate guanylyltransferase